MKYLSLFSGIGGFELGLENAEGSFENIGYSEIDPFADSIYSRWFPNHRNLGDAREIDPMELQDFELLVAGFPCQAFSLGGYRRGFADTRGTLFFEIARICAEKKPTYLLLENVKGLLSHNKGETFKRMLGILSELGYDVEWEVYNSSSFSVPQNRERVYIKGYFRERCGGEILSQRRSRTEASEMSDVPKLHSYKFKRQVKKRTNEVDLDELSSFLRQHKKNKGISISEISSMLQRPITEVEHWFRKDEYFSVPSDEVWYDLKELLDIRDDKYDAYITEYEWVDGVFEQDKRAYEDFGLSPSLTTTETLAKINIVGNLSATNHHGDDVHGIDGLIPSLNSNDYKHYKKILVEGEPSKIKKFGSTNGHQSGDVYETDGLSPTLCGMDMAKSIVKIKEDKEPLKIKANNKKGYDEVVDGDGVRLCHPSSTTARGRTHKGEIGALSTSTDWGTVDANFRIRRLTPLECERLQAFPDNWTKYGKDGKLISDTQRYKCLGNAVTTTVVTYIADTMFGEDFES